VCQENVPQTITLPAPACIVDTRQDGAMDSCCLLQNLALPLAWRNRNRDLMEQSMYFHSSIVQCWCPRVHWSRSFLFLADRSGTRCGRLLPQPIRDKDQSVLRSKIPFCEPPTTVPFFCLLSCQILAILFRPLINKLFSPTGLPLTGHFLFVAPFSVNPKTLLCGRYRNRRAWH
jgi:hypothetical protein